MVGGLESTEAEFGWAGMAGVAGTVSISPVRGCAETAGVAGVAECALPCWLWSAGGVVGCVPVCASAGMAANAKRLVAVNIRNMIFSIIISV